MGLLFIRFVFMNYYQTLNVVLKTCYVGQPVVSAKIKSLDWHQTAIKLNVSGFKLLETLCAIWYYLYDLALACNFTKSNTRPWVFFTLFKLHKWYQIVQRLTFIYIKKAGIRLHKKNLIYTAESFLRIWSHLLRKSLTENFIFCAVPAVSISAGECKEIKKRLLQTLKV